MCTLPQLAFVACVVSSLSLHSDAWTTGGGVRHTFPQQQRLSRAHVSAGSAPAAEPDEQPGPPVKQQQPWWEEERRTQGMPTLSKATQWRMFLTLKVTCGSMTCSVQRQRCWSFSEQLVPFSWPENAGFALSAVVCDLYQGEIFLLQSRCDHASPPLHLSCCTSRTESVITSRQHDRFES